MPKKVYQEVELANYGELGARYRVRLVEGELGRRLDVREWVDRPTYTGFTAKGIRLDRALAARLAEVIREALKAGL